MTDVDIGPFDVDLEVENLYGVYAVFHSDDSNAAQVYGVLGITKGELKVEGPGFSAEEDDSGLSYGIGVNVGAFNLEYMSYLDEDDYDVTAISLGYIAEFD